MAYFDVCNGDADGLCALHQLRLDQPRAATLVTGVKRDIALVERVAAQPGDHVTVLDITLDANRAATLALLQAGVSVDYFDHHAASAIPEHPLFRAVIDPTPDTCTSALVDRDLRGRHRRWAVVGAFGDDLPELAERLAQPCGLAPDQVASLQDLGECLNYNAYGDASDECFVHPAALYESIRPHVDPLRFMAATPTWQAIRRARDRDLALARTVAPSHASRTGDVYVLPDAPWARRVRGILANRLATASPQRAIALLVPDGTGGYSASVRAPRAAPRGAAALCREFPTGGGRQAAAGINHLPAAALPQFVQRFEAAFGAERKK